LNTVNDDESPVLSDCDDDEPTELVPARPTLRALLVLSASVGMKAFFAALTPVALEATAFSDWRTRTLCLSAMPIASWRPIFVPGAVAWAPATAGAATSAAARSTRLHLDADVYAFMVFT
jgi:hypothetical protein